jgi:phosphoglycolate phosphatase-like HAD superfamily hydrolase
MMRSVPPDTGVPADDELLVVGDDVDDELHAARAAAASTAAVSPAKRLGVLIIYKFPMGQEYKRAQTSPLAARAADHYLPGETVRFGRRNPD